MFYKIIYKRSRIRDDLFCNHNKKNISKISFLRRFIENVSEKAQKATCYKKVAK